MDLIVNAYNNVFYEKADPRVKDWLFMKSPWPLFTIIITYLALIKVILPSHMKDRRPYPLNTVIRWYNVAQIVGNVLATWGILTSGWTTTYHFGCLLPDYKTTPETIRMLNFLWWTYILKLMELLETTFFILRKKEKQASFLHVYHHVSATIMIWAAIKFVGAGMQKIDHLRRARIKVKEARELEKNDRCVAIELISRPTLKEIRLDARSDLHFGGMTTFSPMLNNAVHVVMYSYYLLSAEGTPHVKAFLHRHKKWLTILQMTSFNAMLIHSGQVFLPSCAAPLGITIIYFPSVIIVYYMFYKFYQKNYRGKCKSKLIVN